MFPNIDQAIQILKDGLESNPGPWGKHSITVAHCAKHIALASNLDGDKAYVLGLLHDIGRSFGIRYLGHVIDGYKYMLDLDYDEVARVCLSHSFVLHKIDDYIGKFDVNDNELFTIKTKLNEIVFDDYDLLIQLCDAIGGSEGVLDIVDRMEDVKSRYGFYPLEKYQANLKLKQYFEEKMNKDIYEVCQKDSFVPDNL